MLTSLALDKNEEDLKILKDTTALPYTAIVVIFNMTVTDKLEFADHWQGCRYVSL